MDWRKSQKWRVLSLANILPDMRLFLHDPVLRAHEDS